MARAKQTNRAEARRRYRQALVQNAGETEGAEDSAQSGPSSAQGGKPPSSNAQGRPSLTGAFRQAYHPAHVVEDLRALPGLLTLAQPTRIPLTRSVIGVPWFLISAFLVILGFAALATSPTVAISVAPSASPVASTSASGSPGASPEVTGAPATAAPSAGASAVASAGPTAAPAASPEPGIVQVPTSGFGSLLFQVLSLPPGGPTLPVLLVGFMATRASYLQGLLIGLLDLVLIGVYVVLQPSAVSQSTGLADILASAAVTGLPTSVLFAGAAAWYRRFLAMSSPRRPQPAKSSGRGQRPSGRATSRR